MRKNFCVLLCALLLTMAAGCSDSSQRPSEPTTSASAAETTVPTEASNVQMINDNTASAKAEGFGGEITVTLKVEDDVITDCTVDGPDETEGVGSNAVEQLPGKILEANSVEVDGISGCTMSSNAILEAAQQAYDTIIQK